MQVCIIYKFMIFQGYRYINNSVRQQNDKLDIYNWQLRFRDKGDNLEGKVFGGSNNGIWVFSIYKNIVVFL